MLVRIDALLKHGDGTPIVGEFKVATDAGYDTDPFLALLQGLAGATMLATPNQLERLRRWYPLQPKGVVDLALFLYKPPRGARATYQYRLEAAAWLLAHRLLQHKSSPKWLRRIYFIHVHGDPFALHLEMVADASRP